MFMCCSRLSRVPLHYVFSLRSLFLSTLCSDQAEQRVRRADLTSSALTVEQLTPVPFGRRVTSEVFCDGREEYYDPGTYLFDESEH